MKTEVPLSSPDRRRLIQTALLSSPALLLPQRLRPQSAPQNMSIPSPVLNQLITSTLAYNDSCNPGYYTDADPIDNVIVSHCAAYSTVDQSGVGDQILSASSDFMQGNQQLITYSPDNFALAAQTGRSLGLVLPDNIFSTHPEVQPNLSLTAQVRDLTSLHQHQRNYINALSQILAI